MTGQGGAPAASGPDADPAAMGAAPTAAPPAAARFLVDDAPAGDEGRGLLRLPRAAMAALGLRPGDMVRVTAAPAHASAAPGPRGARLAANPAVARPDPSDRAGAPADGAPRAEARRPPAGRDPALADCDPAPGDCAPVLAEGAPAPAGCAPPRADPAPADRDPSRPANAAPARAAHARVLPAREGAAAGRVGLDAALRANAGVGLGDAAALTPAPPPPAALALALRLDRPAEAAALLAALEDVPAAAGDRLIARLPGGRRVTAQVVTLDPAGPARIGAATRLTLQAPAPAEPEAWRGVAGLGPQVARVREMIETPLRRPDLFARLGLTPPRGVLFVGPPGSGKTLLARAVAGATGAAFFQIDGPEVVSKHYGDSEAKLREVFAAAEKRAPSVIFIDEIDAIAPKREGLSGEKQLERRLVAQLLTLMDGLSARGQVVVMAATNMPHALDPALRRPGRFDREIAFAAPDRAARRAILALHFAQTPLAADADLDALAAATAGHVGADLAALAREAAMAALARATLAAGGLDAVDAGALQVTGADLDSARAAVVPSVLRQTRVETPETRFADVGGLDAVKRLLTETVIWPLRRPEALRAMGLTPASGVLLVGPPGGGKTLLAQALAAESGANFIAVRSAQLLSPFLGEAERAVAELFEQARRAAPCILFFDEIDAVAPARGSADPAMARVVAQLLVEIDGIGRGRGVFLLGATNRVGALDPALLRPGRFDEIVALPPPDAAARREILALHAAAVPLAADVDLDAEAAETEGWSGAELRALVQTAARLALRRAVREGAAPGPTGGFDATPDPAPAASSGPQGAAADAGRVAPDPGRGREGARPSGPPDEAGPDRGATAGRGAASLRAAADPSGPAAAALNADPIGPAAVDPPAGPLAAACAADFAAARAARLRSAAARDGAPASAFSAPGAPVPCP